MLPFKPEATAFERFMNKTDGVPDSKSAQWLETEGKLAQLQGDPCRWPLKLSTSWKRMGFDANKEEATTIVAYCVNPKCMRRIKPDEEGSPNCIKCGTPYRHRLPSGKAAARHFNFLPEFAPTGASQYAIVHALSCSPCSF